jgi:hypothetical protein
MSQRSRQGKRTHSERDSENDSPTRSSQRVRRPTAKLQQSTLGFRRPPASQSLLSNVTTRSPSPSIASTRESSTRPPSPSLPPDSLVSPSVQKVKKKPRKHEISAHRRVEFEVDLLRLDGEYRRRVRTKHAFHNAPISWIYLHGVELEKTGSKSWHKHWLCKHCFDDGTMKSFAVDSTYSAGRHLKKAHSIYPPGEQPPVELDRLEPFFEGVHPLQAERWRVDFLNWIAINNITFEQAASKHLRKVILGGGPYVANLLPCARTVRSWLLTTYEERIRDVRKSLTKARSKINLSFDTWSSPNHRSLLGIVAHWIDEDC